MLRTSVIPMMVLHFSLMPLKLKTILNTLDGNANKQEFTMTWEK